MAKINREDVYNKCNGHCAYCGIDIEYKDMQVDHIIPVDSNGSNSIDNLNPSCRRCNKWKSFFSLEFFRNEIQMQIERLNAYNANYRLAKSFGLITENEIKVEFYYEKIKANAPKAQI